MEENEKYKFVKNAVLIDIGGTGARFWSVGPSGQFCCTSSAPIIDSEAALVSHIRKINRTPSAIVISTGGFIDSSTGVVVRSDSLAWGKKIPLSSILRANFGGCYVYVINDGIAHARAAADSPNNASSITLALGTGPAFGVIDRDSRVSFPCTGDYWDIFQLLSPTSNDNKLSEKQQMLNGGAITASALVRLEEEFGELSAEAIKELGTQVGHFISPFVLLFRPRLVILSGGIVFRYNNNWSDFKCAIEDGLRDSLPKNSIDDILAFPCIVKSPFLHAAAIRGAMCILADKCGLPISDKVFSLAVSG